MNFQRIVATFAAVVFITAVSGACYNRYQLAPQELYKLNGYREGQTIQLSSVDGDRVPFNGKTELHIEAGDGQSMNAKYSSVNIEGSTMTGVIRGSGAPVNIDLGQVVNADAKTFSVGKTVGLGVGLGVGIPVVLVTIIVVALVVTASSVSSQF